MTKIGAILILLILGLLAFNFCDDFSRKLPPDRKSPEATSNTPLPIAVSKNVSATGETQIGGPFTLISHKGQKVSDEDFREKLMLVFFGFSNCPEICPTNLNKLSTVLVQLGADADKVSVIFITTDPERDTVEQLSTYMNNFHPSIIALTGSREQIDDVLKKYRIYARKVETPSMQGYMMDHSAIIYLMDKNGKYFSHFSQEETADSITQKVQNLLKN